MLTYVPGTRTVSNLLCAALRPVGQVLYVYGGGWNKTDSGGGPQSTSIGVSPCWKRFFQQQDIRYSYHDFAAQNGKNPWFYAGLDCSGYLGWVLYQVFHTGCGKSSFVVSSTEMADSLARLGLGLRTAHPLCPTELLPGDIVSITGHVWLCLGRCEDDSLVILHSTPSPSHAGTPGGGVQLSALGEAPDCQAFALARTYMQSIAPAWSRRYSAIFCPFSDYTSISGEITGKFSWWPLTACAAVGKPRWANVCRPGLDADCFIWMIFSCSLIRGQRNVWLSRVEM